MSWIRHILAFLLAVAAAAAIGTVASTHFVLASLMDLGMELPLDKRFFAYGQDLVGMTPTFAMIAAVGFAIAFPIAAVAGRFLPRWRAIGYPLAGAVAILTALFLMKALFGMIPLAGARSALGLLAQGLAGAVGGYLFGMISRRSRTEA